MNNTINIDDLTTEQIKKLVVWDYNFNEFSIIYPQKVFWFIYKNVCCVQNGKELTFKTKTEALLALQKIKP